MMICLNGAVGPESQGNRLLQKLHSIKFPSLMEMRISAIKV